MSKFAPPRPSTAEDFVIEIDPSLIEEALAAVDKRAGVAVSERQPASLADDGLDQVGIDLDVDVDDEPAPAANDTHEKRLLAFRIQEQAEQIRRLERDLARAVETRDAQDRLVRDLRKAHGEVVTEFERFRARSRKDVEEAERRGEDKSLRPLVDVFDNVERAWLHAVSDPAQIVGGLQIIVEQFKRLLPRLGLERVDADRGMLFDPACHEAVMHVQAPDVAPGTVVDEVQPGFRLRGRLFRPARVTVSAPHPGSSE